MFIDGHHVRKRLFYSGLAVSISLLAGVLASVSTVWAQTAGDAVVASPALSAPETGLRSAGELPDVVLRAMHDELARTMKSLKLPDYPLPYFGSFDVIDEQSMQITASFGAISSRDVLRSRQADITLRVGDKRLDNSSMGAGLGMLSQRGALVLEDNYDALRRDLWMQADRTYKQAVESLTSAKAQLKYVNIEDRPDSFSDAKPVVSINPGVSLDADLEQWSKRIKALSSVFKEFRTVRESSVVLNVRARTKRLVNSEGTLVKTGETGALIFVSAAAQSKDGMTISDGEVFAADRESELPSQEEMEASIRRLCRRIEALTAAPRASDYQGPVLFEKQAAGELVATLLPSVVCARGDTGFGSEEEHKLGKPVLAASISVLDDPIVKSYQGKTLKSGWTIDYEGVESRPVKVVEKGVLKEVLSTRTPSQLSKVSNGHNRGGGASPGHLFLSSDAGVGLTGLKQKLIEEGKKEGLDSVLIVRRTMPSYLGSGSSRGLDLIRYIGGRGSVFGPNLVYRVDVKTGKEELIRGARIKTVSKKNLLTMQAACDDSDVYVVSYPTDRSATTIGLVTPSVLLPDVEFAKPQRTTELPPYLENPYFEEVSK